MITIVVNPTEVKFQKSEDLLRDLDVVRASDDEIIGHLSQQRWVVQIARHENQVAVTADINDLLKDADKKDYPDLVEDALITMLSELNWVLDPEFAKR